MRLVSASAVTTSLATLTVLISISTIVPLLLSVSSLLLLLLVRLHMRLLIALLISGGIRIMIARLESRRLLGCLAVARLLVSTVSLRRRTCGLRRRAVAVGSAVGSAGVVALELSRAEDAASAGAMPAAAS